MSCVRVALKKKSKARNPVRTSIEEEAQVRRAICRHRASDQRGHKGTVSNNYPFSQNRPETVVLRARQQQPVNRSKADAGIYPYFMQADRKPDLNQLAVVAAECAALNVRKASRTITRLYAAAFEETGLEPTQFTLLVACCRTQRVTMSGLAERLSMDRSALARNVSILERRGLLEVDPGRDRRERHISATAAGRNKLCEALPHWHAVQGALVEMFGRETFTSMISTLQAMTRTGQALLQDRALLQDADCEDVAS
jgi:DNA-binding MarR family transcriptional regulator